MQYFGERCVNEVEEETIEQIGIQSEGMTESQLRVYQIFICYVHGHSV